MKERITELQQTFNDWRLPTIKELLTLVNYDKYKPACNLEDTKVGCYWSSSRHISSSYRIWYVNFKSGNAVWYDKDYSFLVRCVRDGEGGLEWSATSEKPMTNKEAIEYANNLVATVYYKG